MATLTVSHYIYLTKEQRYSLHAGEPVQTVGVSVPVWFHKGSTSEPAKEIFCTYRITNDKVNRIIELTNDGYDMNIPQIDALPNDPESERLLDIPDGGSEYLDFRQYGKTIINNEEYNSVHFVEMKTIETLKATLS